MYLLFFLVGERKHHWLSIVERMEKFLLFMFHCHIIHCLIGNWNKDNMVILQHDAHTFLMHSCPHKTLHHHRIDWNQVGVHDMLKRYDLFSYRSYTYQETAPMHVLWVAATTDILNVASCAFYLSQELAIQKKDAFTIMVSMYQCCVVAGNKSVNGTVSIILEGINGLRGGNKHTSKRKHKYVYVETEKLQRCTDRRL